MTGEKMRIALFTDTYAPQVNGVARTLGRLVGHATDNGHEVVLVTPRISERAAEGVERHLQLGSISVPLYPSLQLARPMGPIGAAQLRGFAPDVAHVATEFTVGWSGVRWSLDHEVPLVTSFHTDFPAYLAGYGLGRLEKQAWWYLRAFHRQSIRTFCPSRATVRQLRAQGFDHPLSVWSRGVNADHFHPRRRRASVRRRLGGAAEQLVVCVGRLAPEKRVDVLLEAFRHVRGEQGTRVALAIVGDGPSRAALEARAPDGVVFTGFLKGAALAEAYAAGDVFAFPSDTETFGNVVLEAMASGLPVVAPSRGGVTDFVRHGETGVLVEPQDARALADGVLRLLADEGLRVRMSARAREEAEGRSWTTIFDRLFEQYGEAVNRHRMMRFVAA
jgi:glycosyltransferase involved in cell wall biosynthesis